MKRVMLVVGFALGCAALGWFARDWGLPRSSHAVGTPGEESASSTSRNPGGKLQGAARGPVALGRLEPAGKVIDLSALPGDCLDSLAVDENAEVRKNDPLAYLDSRIFRELEMEAARSQRLEAETRRVAEEKVADARIAAAKAALNQAGAYEGDLKVAESKVALLRTNLALAKLTQQRLKALAATDIVSPQDREEQELAVAKAEAELNAAEIAVEKGRSAGKLGVAAAEADLEAALAGKKQVLSTIAVESLKKREELAKAQWERTIVRAPCDGTVLKVFLRPGEALGVMPILQLADRSRMVVVAEVYEGDVKRLRAGQKSKVLSKAFPAPYDETGLEGVVSRIGRTISQPDMKKLNPLAESDRHVIEVRVDLDARGSKVAADFIHLQVEVQFAPASP
jgi:HlyD family secretion protein